MGTPCIVSDGLDSFSPSCVQAVSAAHFIPKPECRAAVWPSYNSQPAASLTHGVQAHVCVEG
jgi:hypothetical protein